MSHLPRRWRHRQVRKWRLGPPGHPAAEQAGGEGAALCPGPAHAGWCQDSSPGGLPGWHLLFHSATPWLPAPLPTSPQGWAYLPSWSQETGPVLRWAGVACRHEWNLEMTPMLGLAGEKCRCAGCGTWTWVFLLTAGTAPGMRPTCGGH